MKTQPPDALQPATIPAAKGFTRTDLLAVLAAGGVLSGLFLPALANGGGGSAAAGCLNNLRQLSQALWQFAEDHGGWFPKNPDDGASYNWIAGQAGIGGTQEFSPELTAKPETSALAGYLGGRPEVFRCPADTRAGRYQGTNVAWQGQIVPAACSYALNGAVGTQGGGTNRVGNAPVDGAWLDGVHNNRHNNPWRTYGRPGQIIEPGPAGLFVFLDEHPASLNDGHFAVSMTSGTQTRWVDWPASHHDFGAGFGFADGHAELHSWADERTLVRNNVPGTSSVPNSPDVTWLQTRTSARAR